MVPPCGPPQGLTLDKPEMVPFRLTQNLIDGFGVSGYEGVFRRVAEVTLQVCALHARHIGMRSRPVHCAVHVGPAWYASHYRAQSMWLAGRRP